VLVVHHGDVVETLSANGPDQTLDVRILPRTPRCCLDLLDSKTGDATVEKWAIDVVAIAQEVARRVGVGECLDDLLRGPLRRGVGGDMEVKRRRW